jgi:hypothetical protein
MDWGWFVAGVLYALPVIEALIDWDALVDQSREAGEALGFGGERFAAAVAVIATLLWPVTCVVSMVSGGRE